MPDEEPERKPKEMANLCPSWSVWDLNIEDEPPSSPNILQARGTLTIAEILGDFPTLNEEAVRAVIAFAAASAEEDLPVPPTPVPA